MNNPSTAFDESRSWGEFQPSGLARFLFGVLYGLPRTRRPFYSVSKLVRGPIKNAQPRVFDVYVLGLFMRLLTRGNYCETTLLFSPQFYDAEELDWVCNSLYTGDVFLDIGANVGLYSLIAARQCPGVRVIAIEPDPLLANRMKFNARNNGLIIESVPLALSDYEGVGTLQRSEYQSGGNQLAVHKDRPSNNSELADVNQANRNIFDVHVSTLIALCEEHGITKIGTLKIDIEGHELKVLAHFFQNAPKTLWPNHIVIERVHDSGGIVPRLIKDYGYRERASSARNVLLDNTNSSAVEIDG
ncbi:MAG: FkbM family methyltransferase [Gammaproteobacteria bacterium]|nr:FkbM family methyltransferase [Gammaproteobacteria bacterium]